VENPPITTVSTPAVVSVAASEVPKMPMDIAW